MVPPNFINSLFLSFINLILVLTVQPLLSTCFCFKKKSSKVKFQYIWYNSSQLCYLSVILCNISTLLFHRILSMFCILSQFYVIVNSFFLILCKSKKHAGYLSIHALCLWDFYSLISSCLRKRFRVAGSSTRRLYSADSTKYFVTNCKY